MSESVKCCGCSTDIVVIQRTIEKILVSEMRARTRKITGSA
jgi:hypothetical protein